MTTIVTRSGKAAPLTNTELDTNFTNLNTDKLEKGSNLSDLQSVSQARTNLGLGDLATQNKASLTGPVVLTDSSTSPALKITQTGTGNALVVEDAASDTTPFAIDQSGNVGIGATPEPSVVLTVRGAQRNHRHSANDASPIYHANIKARGTSGTSLTVNNGDGIASYQAYAYDGSGERQASSIVMQVDGVPATSTVPGRIIFSTTPAGTSQVPLERLRIDSSGNVLVKSAAGLGYGTGAGGTVNQTGGRTTGVTLSKPTGSITLVSAAGSTTWQSFTVTNTTVAAEDVVVVSQKSGTDKYMIHVTNVAAGFFQITFATTGGTTTEQPVFSFAIIKGATA